MITFEKLYETLKKRGISTYALEKEYHISKGQLDRIKKNESISTNTVDMLCDILDCNVDEIMTYHRKEEH